MTFAEFEKALELIAEKKVSFSKRRHYLDALVLGLSVNKQTCDVPGHQCR